MALCCTSTPWRITDIPPPPIGGGGGGWCLLRPLRIRHWKDTYLSRYMHALIDCVQVISKQSKLYLRWEQTDYKLHFALKEFYHFFRTRNSRMQHQSTSKWIIFEHRLSHSHTIATTSRRPLTTTFFWVLGGGCHPLSMTTSGNHHKKSGCQRSATGCRYSVTVA